MIRPMNTKTRCGTIASNPDVSPDLRITLAPYGSVRKACRVEGVSNATMLSMLIRGKEFPGWKAAGKRIAEHFGLNPEDAFPRFDWTGEVKLVKKEESDEDARECIATVLVTLTDREAEVLKMYYGLDGTPMTLLEIGERFGIGRERVRQIRNKALAKLRHPKRLRLLEELR